MAGGREELAFRTITTLFLEPWCPAEIFQDFLSPFRELVGIDRQRWDGAVNILICEIRNEYIPPASLKSENSKKTEIVRSDGLV